MHAPSIAVSSSRLEFSISICRSIGAASNDTGISRCGLCLETCRLRSIACVSEMSRPP